MEGKTWIAILACLGIWYFYVTYLAPKPPEKQQPPQTTQVEKSTQPTTGGEVGTGLFAQAPAVSQNTTVERDRLKVTFSDLGGRIGRAILPEFTQSIEPDAPNVAPIEEGENGFSLATLFSKDSLRDLTQGEYQREEGEGWIRYKRKSESGVTLVKEYRFGEDAFLLDATFRFTFPEGQQANWGDLILPVGAKDIDYSYSIPMKAWEVVTYQNESIERTAAEKLELEPEVFKGDTNWLAYGNRYFTTVVINKSELNPDVVMLSSENFSGGYLRFPLVLKRDQRDLEFNFQFYIGAKEVVELEKVPGLRRLIDYGFFSFLAYPLLELMKFFYSFIRNWGVAIILLTIVVRLAFFPLQAKSMKSMKAMQKLKPQIDALKEKYKDDKERFSKEQMALLKTHKVNPLGGCLPLLVQLPVFIALYAVLANSIELFHAPFLFWIQDLSSKDPLYIYPVLMGITMFGHQKMTPSVGMDPTQAKIMLLMPVIFTVIMLNLPSGLTLYIFVSTLIGLVQQFFQMKDRKEAPKVAKEAPQKVKG